MKKRNVFHNSNLRNKIFPTIKEENNKQKYNSISLRKPSSNYNLQIPVLPSFRNKNSSRNVQMISFNNNKFLTSINKTEIKNKKSFNFFSTTNQDNKNPNYHMQ